MIMVCHPTWRGIKIKPEIFLNFLKYLFKAAYNISGTHGTFGRLPAYLI